MENSTNKLFKIKLCEIAKIRVKLVWTNLNAKIIADFEPAENFSSNIDCMIKKNQLLVEIKRGSPIFGLS
jgi:hypothetical protein